MPRLQIPTSWSSVSSSDLDSEPAFQLNNPSEHAFFIHPLSPSVVRVVHQLPLAKFPQKTNGGIIWEPRPAGISIQNDESSQIATVETSALSIQVSYASGIRLSWSRKLSDSTVDEPFLTDCKTRAYTFDASSGAVFHYVERELYLPTSEDEFTDTTETYVHDRRNEFVYGLGETGGRLIKDRRRFTMEAKDSLAYDWRHGDPLYKIAPFYVVYNRKSNLWHGIFYNNLSGSVFDMGAECDAFWGSFRSYRANCGPLDYYVILADGTLPSVIQAYASLVTPGLPEGSFASSPSLPPLSQFGYLASSLALAEQVDAQGSIIDFVNTSRKDGFPIDGLHLSSGWCQDAETGDRNYFVWNKERYPSPTELGSTLEKSLSVKVIVNIKPWLLDDHPLSSTAGNIFVSPALEDGNSNGPQKSILWSSGFGDHKIGSYIDFSSLTGSTWWKERIEADLLGNNVTGMWIDNNEFSGLDDDESRYKGDIDVWDTDGVATSVSRRMGWDSGEVKVGQVGRAVQTMGMAKATYEALLKSHPQDRPVIVSRSGLPGIQAYAHASWSGDNGTTWAALKWGTKMTLSVGISFGPGLYGHDIGGFAGSHSPSPELLVRWCQQGSWHTRFTVHSWKAISTTLWMYNDVPGITAILREVLGFRYRLAPTLYSFYVTHYHRKAWPVLKPLLWHHSCDPRTLGIDDQFIVGTHTLVAPVLDKGAVKKNVYLSPIANDGEKYVWWCEIDTGIWHAPEEDGQYISMDAPLSRIPVLVRAGGIILLGGQCCDNIFDGVNTRTALIFPSPRQAGVRTSPLERSGMNGRFTLIEDDGISNDHTSTGAYTELEICFHVVNDEESPEIELVEVECKVIHGGYPLPYEQIWFVLPKGDRRTIRSVTGKPLEVKVDDNEVRMSALTVPPLNLSRPAEVKATTESA